MGTALRPAGTVPAGRLRSVDQTGETKLCRVLLGVEVDRQLDRQRIIGQFTASGVLPAQGQQMNVRVRG
jgi:hypothetical protein